MLVPSSEKHTSVGFENGAGQGVDQRGLATAENFVRGIVIGGRDLDVQYRDGGRQARAELGTVPCRALIDR